jgi:hypothetical protein
MTATMVNLAYMFAAGHGHCGALSDLSTGYLSQGKPLLRMTHISPLDFIRWGDQPSNTWSSKL